MAERENRNADLHRNHRQRLRARFANEGIGAFEDHNVLELLLFYAIPRKDTNEIAHLLLEEFGTLSGVFDAPAAQLASVPGIGEETALFLKLIPAVCSRYLSDMEREVETIHDSAQAAEKLRPFFLGTENERLVCMIMNTGGQILRIRLIDEGGTGSVTANLESIVYEAVSCRGKNVVIAHSHPSGFAAPSESDVAMTLELSRRLRAAGINLCEHVIFAKSDSCFLSDHRQIPADTLLFRQIDR